MPSVKNTALPAATTDIENEKTNNNPLYAACYLSSGFNPKLCDRNGSHSHKHKTYP